MSTPDFPMIKGVNLADAEIVDASLDRKLNELSNSNQFGFNDSPIITHDELMAADDNRFRPLTAMDNNPELENLLNSQLERYNTKYNTNLSYDTLKSYLKFALEGSSEERQVKGLITSDLIYNSVKFALQKAILVFVNQFNIMLDNVQRESMNQDIGPTLLITLDKIMDYIGRLEELAAKYKVYDLDRSIDNVKRIEGSSSNNPGIDYNAVKTGMNLLIKSK